MCDKTNKVHLPYILFREKEKTAKNRLQCVQQRLRRLDTQWNKVRAGMKNVKVLFTTESLRRLEHNSTPPTP
jgi:hypothetical protein